MISIAFLTLFFTTRWCQIVALMIPCSRLSRHTLDKKGYIWLEALFLDSRFGISIPSYVNIVTIQESPFFN